MIVCPKCHKHSEDRVRFCTECGTSLHTLSDNEKNTERLKEQSRELARGNHRSPLKDELRKMGLARYKGYPVLSFISTVMFIGGCLLILVGVIGFQPAFFNRSGDAPRSETTTESTATTELTDSIGNGAVKALAGFAIYSGLGFIANAEMLKLFIDLQANADRQSILLTLVLDRMKENEENK